MTILVLAVGASGIFGGLSWPMVVLVGLLALIGLIVVLRLPVVRDEAETE